MSIKITGRYVPKGILKLLVPVKPLAFRVLPSFTPSTPSVGQTITANMGTYNAGAQASVQWYVDGVLKGNGNTFTTTAGNLTMKVTLTRGQSTFSYTSPAVTVDPMIILKSSFDPTDGWVPGTYGNMNTTYACNIENDPQVARTGNYYWHHYISGTDAYLRRSIPVTQGKRYRVEFWARATSGDNPFSLYAGDNRSPFYRVSTVWTKFSFEFTASVTDLYGIHSSFSGSQMLYDDLTIFEL